jgi:hypothetical protein
MTQIFSWRRMREKYLCHCLSAGKAHKASVESVFGAAAGYFFSNCVSFGTTW